MKPADHIANLSALPSDEVIRSAYEALREKHFNEVDWKRFEGKWTECEPNIVCGDHYVVSGQSIDAAKIKDVCKTAFKGYISLFKENGFLIRARDSMYSSKDEQKDMIQAALEKSLVNYRTAVSMHTHETYQELKQLGLDHQNAYTIMERLVQESSKGYEKVTRESLKSGRRVPREALSEHMPPQPVRIIDGVDNDSGKAKQFIVSAGENTTMTNADPDVQRLVEQHFGNMNNVTVRSGLKY